MNVVFLRRWAFVALALIALVWTGARIENAAELRSASTLLAKAYAERRISNVRFPEAPYAVRRIRRSAQNAFGERPPSLVEAEAEIATHLKARSPNTSWLQLKSKADLLEGDFEAAIATLSSLQKLNPNDFAIQDNLAIAYFERAEMRGDHADYQQAKELWSSLLAKNPDDITALFNRALAAQSEEQFADAIADWDRYLKIDPAGEWAAEAREWRTQAAAGSKNH